MLLNAPAPLDLSVRESTVGTARRALLARDGTELDGRGVVIGDVDSPIFVFHPMLFNADAGSFRWIDANRDGMLTLGTDGVDLDNPGTALDRSGHPNPVPRIVGPVRRTRPVEVEDVRFLRAHTDRPIKMTVPGPFTMAQQAQNDYYPSEEAAAMDYAVAVNAEIRDLFAAGADVVQVDEPYMQARPEKARQFGLTALNRALDGITGVTAVHICFGYAAIIHQRPSGYSFLPELAGCPVTQVSIETAHPWRRSSTGTTRRSSSSSETSAAPGRVDSPPTSTIVAPSASIRRPVAAASAGDAYAPPSEKLSGVTFTIPITAGRCQSSVSGSRLIGHGR